MRQLLPVSRPRGRRWLYAHEAAGGGESTPKAVEGYGRRGLGASRVPRFTVPAQLAYLTRVLKTPNDPVTGLPNLNDTKPAGHTAWRSLLTKCG